MSGDEGDEGTTAVQIIAASATVRAGLAALVGADERFVVSGNHSGVAEAMRDSDDSSGHQPDVVIVELGEAPDEGLAELTNYREETDAPPPAVVALVPDSQLEAASELLRAGARAVLPRSASGGEIVAAVEAASAGLTVVHADAARALLADSDHSPSAPVLTMPTSPAGQHPDALTPRETEVLGMLAEGMGNKTVAYRLGISEHTVKFHVASIMAKLGAGSRTEAVTLGVRRGLIML